MTAKHRRGKGNHKHEDNFFKNEVIESEVRDAGSNYTPLVVLLAIVAVGGAIGAWFCIQQHQTLSDLTDNVMGLQMKIARLQSSHEEVRQSSGKHISENLETRLNALEESHALSQKQVGIALATAEQLKMSDLPTQVLSLHTEMKSRLAEMQQATVSLEQVSHLQTMLKGQSHEFEDVKVQVGSLAELSTELFQKVEVLTESVGDAESQVGQVTTLSISLVEQAAEMLRLKEQLDTQQAQLKASTAEMATVREMLEKREEESQQIQWTSMEEQLSTVYQSLEEQNAAAQNLQSQLTAKLANIQKQVAKMRQSIHRNPELTSEVHPAAEEMAHAVEEVAASATEGEVEEADAIAQNAEGEVEKNEDEAAGDDVVPAEEVQSEKQDNSPEEEEGGEDPTQAEEEQEAEEEVHSHESRGSEVLEESSVDEEADEEEENPQPEGEEAIEEEGEQDVAAAEDEDEAVDEPLERDALPDNHCFVQAPTQESWNFLSPKTLSTVRRIS